MDELLYTVAGAAAVRATPVTLAEVGLREREHLQEWVLAHPEMLGGSLLVITSECDRWASVRGRERDRLDVLALDPDGHLVVVELKRDEAPETVELQALKYAAFCSRFTAESLVEEFRSWRARNGEDLDVEAAVARLEGHLAEDVGGLAGAPLSTPRIVLLAGGFTPATTAVAVWLRQMGVDITLRAVRAYATEAGPVVSVSAVYPTPSVEEFTVSPLLAGRKREEADRRAARAEPAVRQLLTSGALDPGAELRILAAGPDADTFAAWATVGDRNKAVWAGTPSRPLRWASEDAGELQATGNFSVTGLVHWLYKQAGAATPAGAATQLVVTADGRSLAELAGTGGAPSTFDAAGLHRLLAALPKGRWASYGNIAPLVRTAAQPLGRHVTTCSRCENAWRVLQDSGCPAAGFRWSDPERTDSVQKVLEDEGVRFIDDAADPGQRLTSAELQALLADDA
jgi:alkylated DNA nucleotide flippase Atl1